MMSYKELKRAFGEFVTLSIFNKMQVLIVSNPAVLISVCQ